MVHLAWRHHQRHRGRKTPLYGVEKGHRRQGPVAKKITRWVTFIHVSEVPIVPDQSMKR